MSPRKATKDPLAAAKRKARELRDGTFVALMRQYGIPAPEREWSFAKDLKPRARAWRFDFAWPKQRVALEIEGGVWSRGAHGRGAGIVRDMEKYSVGATMGWRILRIQPKQMDDLATVKLIARTLGFINL